MAEIKMGTIELSEEAGKELMGILRKHGVLKQIAEDIEEKVEEEEELSPEEKLLNRIFGNDEEWEDEDEVDEREEMFAVYFALISTLAEEGYRLDAKLYYDEDGLPMISTDVYKD